MEEEYEKFINFDWNNEDWQKYLDSLEPTPPYRQLTKWKKKWYKKAINPEFDVTYEPPTSSAPSGGYTPSGGAPSGGFSFPSSGNKWERKSKGKAAICLLAYGVAMSMSVASALGAVFPAHTALLALVGAFVLEIVAKYGIKLNSNYLQAVLTDDIGIMPMMVMTLLMPGLIEPVKLCGMVSPFLTALLSIGMIAKAVPGLPSFLKKLGDATVRSKVMQIRADSEVFLGFALLFAAFATKAPMPALLYWNFMMMRHMMSPWTQASFRKIDGVLEPTIGRIPLVKNAYAAIKRGLSSFVDPEKRQSGGGSLLSKCSIL